MFKAFVAFNSAFLDMRGAARCDHRDALAGSKKCNWGNRRLPIVLLSDLAGMILIRHRMDYPLSFADEKAVFSFPSLPRIGSSQHCCDLP
jgi:hypothetical protein